MLLKKILRQFRAEWTPRLLDIMGFGLIVMSIGIAFGLAPALAATGVACLTVGWAVSSS